MNKYKEEYTIAYFNKFSKKDNIDVVSNKDYRLRTS